MNHYEFLGVSRDATDDEIKTVYKNMAKKYHPDVYRGDSDTANEKMQEINAAYETLSDNAKREEYDYSLWLEERQNPDEILTERYGHYQEYVRPERPRKPFKPASKEARRIMRIVWAVRITVAVVLLYIAAGIIFRFPTTMDMLDRIYGRGTPAKVTEMYFDSIKELNFNRNEQLTIGAAMAEIRSDLQHAYNFEAYGVQFGEIWFGSIARDLRIKVLSTERRNFSSAGVTVRVTNLNMEKLFIQAQENIANDLRNGTGELVLRRAVTDSDISLVGEIYSTYLNNLPKSSLEYTEAEFTLNLYRPGLWWNIIGTDNINQLRNVVLGGFGDNFEDCIINWYEELGIE